MSSLFATVATDDGVTEEQVREAAAQRPFAFDFAVMLSFAVLYFLVANAMALRVWRRFPIQDGWMAGIIATAAVSIVVSAAAVFAGDIWTGIAENIRVGNGHLSYRLDRIPWRHHHVSLFIAGIALFWIAATIQSRRRRPEPTLTLLVPHSSVE